MKHQLKHRHMDFVHTRKEYIQSKYLIRERIIENTLLLSHVNDQFDSMSCLIDVMKNAFSSNIIYLQEKLTIN